MAETSASAPSTPRHPWVLGAVVLCFFASGAAGLIYEVSWNRWLTLLMGNTSYALATLLSVFMGGLALGAWAGGRWAPTGRRALRVYGLLEIGIGLYCLLLPSLFAATRPLFAVIYREHYESLFAFSLMQFCVVALMLLIPTALMGATLPILVRFVVRRLGLMGGTVGGLYAVNSAGAFAGAMLTGLVFLPTIGTHSTHLTAVAINVVVGVAALTAAALVSRSSPEERPVTAPVRAAGPALQPPSLLLIAFGISGFTAMVYQVAWTRAVTLAIGSSTYAFTLMVGSFILGLALGSAALGRIADTRWNVYAVGLLPLAIGFSALLTVFWLAELPIRMTRLVLAQLDFSAFEWVKFRSVLLMFLPATFCMGGLLPLVSRLIAPSGEQAGRSVGNAYAVNTVGTIAGSFCGGFVLIPWVGMRGSILIASAASIVIGLALLFPVLRGGPARVLGLGIPTALALFVFLTVPRWEPSVMSSGPFAHADNYAADVSASDLEIRDRMRQRILSFEEGATTLVAVTEYQDGRRNLVVGGKIDASSYATIQGFLGHLPMFLRAEAERVLVVGLGSGQTAAAVAVHPGVKQIDVVEVSPEVVRAARDHFADFTNNILDDPRVRLIVGDARVHLEHTDRRYDVIISQPSNPWIAGAAPLFTRESFERMKQRLNPGGLVCIWSQGFGMPVDMFRVLARTWGEVWPHPSIWTSRSPGSHLLVGSDEPLAIEFSTLERLYGMPAVNGEMRRMKMPTPAHLLGYLITEGPALREFAGNLPVNTDDNARIEYDAPRGMGRDRSGDLLVQLHGSRVDPWDYVLAGATPGPGFAGNRELGRRILADQRLILESLGVRSAGRAQMLQEVLRRNPHDSLARRELRALGRNPR